MDTTTKYGEKFMLAGLEFTNITGEGVREYVLHNKVFVQIPNPIGLHVGSGGGHRIFNAEKGYYVQTHEGWFISWTRRQDIEIDESAPEGEKEKVVGVADAFVM